MDRQPPEVAHPPSRPALRIAVIYAIVSGVYILCSDALLQAVLPESSIQKITKYQSLKGLLFVLTTAALLYVLIRRAMRDLHRSQEALRRSEQSLSQAQELAQLGNWEWDIDTGQIRWSRELYRLYDLPEDRPQPTYEQVAQRIDERDRSRVARVIDRAIQFGEEYTIEYRVVLSDGTERHIYSQGRVDRRADGRVQRLRGTALDITARKVMEDELRQLNEGLELRVAQRTAELQQANEDLRTFSYTISHDLRTPVRGMSRLAEELLQLESAQADEQSSERARRIVAGTARLDRLIQDLFEYNQLARSEIHPQQISLILLTSDVVGQMKREPAFAEAQINVREPMQSVLAHRPTLALVLSNLLHNAVRFMAPGVRPIVSIWTEPRDNGFVRLNVEDNGVGMEPARAASIFHLFEQPHESSECGNGGSGIGLAVVRRGVERMGGSVGVESRRGAGSRFWIELPRDPDNS